MTELTGLSLSFAQRMVADLSGNNVLRGAWAEHLVAHFLGVTEMPPNWTYYDMRVAGGHELSVKHSVGPRAKFSVAMAKWAWDPELARNEPGSQGWRGDYGAPPAYWCQIYVFGWLDSETSEPALDQVLNPSAWLFAALSRTEMHQRFVEGRDLPQKGIGLGPLRALTEFFPGEHLAAKVAGLDLNEGPGVPPRPLDARPTHDVGPPVFDGGEIVPAEVTNG